MSLNNRQKLTICCALLSAISWLTRARIYKWTKLTVNSYENFGSLPYYHPMSHCRQVWYAAWLSHGIPRFWDKWPRPCCSSNSSRRRCASPASYRHCSGIVVMTTEKLISNWPTFTASMSPFFSAVNKIVFISFSGHWKLSNAVWLLHSSSQSDPLNSWCSYFWHYHSIITDIRQTYKLHFSYHVREAPVRHQFKAEG